MINPDKLFGRLGNRMFQMAALYAHSKEINSDIYFQDPKYFEKYEEEIKDLFGTGIGYLKSISVHVRRGANPINPDEPKYSENPFYVNLSETDYYDRAMALFPSDTFLVFTDDIEWCKEKWADNPRVQVMEGGDEIEDFNLMASCKHNIIANSSYSWWAAYLNPNFGKIVIYPKEWFSDKVERVGFPKTWTKM